MFRHRTGIILLSFLFIAILSGCSSSSSETSGESSEDILNALATIGSVDTSILLELDAHTGVSGASGSHTVSISSDVSISALLEPVAYHSESFSRILVDGVTTREDKEYYVVPEDEGYAKYEYTAETDTWTLSELSKSQILSLPIQTGFVNDWPALMECLEETSEEVEIDDETVAVLYKGEARADLIQDFFGNNIFGSFLYSLEYLLTEEIPCTVLFDLATGMPLELQLDISECFIVNDMEIDYGAIIVKYSNFNQTDEIDVAKKVSIVASNPTREFYSSYYIWNLFLPYMNSTSASSSAGNSGLAFEANWNTFQVRIDSGMTALPMSYADLNHIGYELDTSYVTKTLDANQTAEFVPVFKGNDILYCTFYNDLTEVQSITACKVVSLDLRAAECPDENIQMYLPGEITLGVTKDALFSAYGQPDAEEHGFSADTYIWYNKGADGVSILQQSFTAEISPVTGTVVRLFLQNVPTAIIAVSPAGADNISNML